MDIILEYADSYLFDKVYATLLPRKYVSDLPAAFSKYGLVGGHDANASIPLNPGGDMPEVYGLRPFLHELNSYTNDSLWPRDNILRQSISLFLIAALGGYFVYFAISALSYRFIFDQRNKQHPRFLKNQVMMEIKMAAKSIPIMVIYTMPAFLLELRGYSQLYYHADTYGYWYLGFQIVIYILFTDMGIYLIHRYLHHPLVYKHWHKPHHKWIVPTPFASYAFHPLDGFLQSTPYHIAPFIFPINKVVYLVMFVFVQAWSISIHDGEYLANNEIVNGAACHTVHHLYFNYNYGQYTTLWDRLGGTYRKPENELFDPSAKMAKSTWKEQIEKFEVIQSQVEDGKDEREYVGEDKKNR